jgi:hypothetical protein
MDPSPQSSISENVESDRPYTNYSLRTFLLAMQDVIGERGVAAMLNAARLERFIGHLPPNNLEPGVTFSDYTRLNLASKSFTDEEPGEYCNVLAGQPSNMVSRKSRPHSWPPKGC